MRPMIYHISDTDLDGLGCQVVSTHAFKLRMGRQVNLLWANHDNIDQVITSVLEDMGPGDVLYVTDISPQDREVMKAMHARYRQSNDSIVLIDHHKSAKSTLRMYQWAHVDTEKSATLLLYEHLTEKLPYIDERWQVDVADFVRVVNDYDMWIHADGRSDRLNILLSTFADYEGFITRFVENPKVRWTETEAAIIDLLVRKRNAYVERSIELATFMEDHDPPYVRVFAEDHASMVGHELLRAYPKAAFAVIFNMREGRASLRSREMDVSALAKERGGGGHLLAAGYPISEGDLKF